MTPTGAGEQMKKSEERMNQIERGIYDCSYDTDISKYTKKKTRTTSIAVLELIGGVGWHETDDRCEFHLTYIYISTDTT